MSRNPCMYVVDNSQPVHLWLVKVYRDVLPNY